MRNPGYGLNRLDIARRRGHLYLTEGESDAWALWACELPALGLPGSGSANALEAEHLADVHDLYVLPDNDKAGKDFCAGVHNRLQTIGFKGRVWHVQVPQIYKDVGDWFAANETGFLSDLEGAVLNGKRMLVTGAFLPPVKPAAPRVLRQLPAYRPFPQNALPPILGEYVVAAAEAVGCDPALVAPHALAVAAGAIGNSRAIRLKRGWSEPAVVWALTVAASGRLKSPGYDKAVSPYMEIQMGQVDDHDEKATRRSTWERKSKTERGSCEEPEDPGPQPCIVTSDATIEAVGELLRDNPRGLLLARDELDGWFQGFTRFKKSGGGTDRPHWLEMHRASTLRLHRLTRERGPLSVRRACCSLCGTIQPAVLARCLDAEAVAAGLGARFLMAMPPSRRRRWSEAEVSEDLTDRYKSLLQSLLDKPMADKTKRLPHFLALSSAAKRVWVDWFNAWGERMAGSQEEQAAVMAKLEGYAARLALVYHVVAYAAADEDDVRDVGERSMKAGIALVEWFAHEAWRVYASCRETTDERDRRGLLEWIGARGGRVTAKHLQDSLRHRYPLAEDAEAALAELAKADLGHWEEQPSGPKGGRPTRIFVLNENSARETRETSDGAADGAQGQERETTRPPRPALHNPRENGGFAGFAGAVSGNGEGGGQAGEVSRNGEVSRAPGGETEPQDDPQSIGPGDPGFTPF